LDIFTIHEDLSNVSKPKTDTIVDTIIRFPTSLGLTGAACNDRAIYFANDIKKDNRINSDIDNLLAIRIVKNILVSEISIDHIEGLRIGVI